MNSDHAIVDLAPIAVPLPGNAHGMFAALGRARLVHTTDGLGMGMVPGNDPLAAITQFFFIPFNRFEKSLHSPWRLLAMQSNSFSVLAWQIG